jgi:predicted dehydrogenase
MVEHDLKIGVIGFGIRGTIAEYAHAPEDGVLVVAGADIDADALSRFKAAFGPDVTATHDYRALLARADIDAVFVMTPDHLHEEHAVAALEAGKAVFLEKPMAITIEGCDRILQTAQDRKGKLYIGHNMRHMALIQKMKDLVDCGAIGEVRAGWCRHFVSYGGDAYFKDWHSERAKTTGLLLQKGSHDIDVLHWLCGGYAKRVNAMGGLTLYHKILDRRKPNERTDARFRLENWPPRTQKGLSPVIDVEDLSIMQMELDNGVFASYQQCHYTPDAWRNYTIIGTEGRIENFGDDPPNAVVKVWNRRTGYNPDGDEQYVIPQEPGGHGGCDPKIVDEFIRYVREGGSTTTSPIASRYSVAAGYMATLSLRAGGAPFDVPPLDADLAAYFAEEGEWATEHPGGVAAHT